MKQVTVTLADDEYAKLEKLAELRKSTPAECLRRMVQACQPGGSGWEPPSKTKPLPDKPVEAEKEKKA